MKVKEEELKTIKDQQEKINSILHQLGYLESQKHGLLHELAGVNQDVEKFKNNFLRVTNHTAPALAGRGIFKKRLDSLLDPMLHRAVTQTKGKK